MRSPLITTGPGFLGGAGRLLVALLAAALLLFIGFPLVALFLNTPPGTLWSDLQTESSTSALTLSMQTTGITLFLTILLGTPTAYILARRRFPGKRLLDSV